ncbi:MAG: NADPH-dependent FMN reductase [Phormidesmis sp.]
MFSVLAISGSLRSQSSNTRLLRAITPLTPPTLTLSIYQGMGSLPHFNPDLDNLDPDGLDPDTSNLNLSLAAVREWRSHLRAADAVLFCTPEYAHGIPGVLKNALDWIVSSGEFMNKPTAVVSASPSPDGGAKANASLTQTLKVMMASLSSSTSLCIPAISAKLDPQGKLTDPETIRAISDLLSALNRRLKT